MTPEGVRACLEAVQDGLRRFSERRKVPEDEIQVEFWKIANFKLREEGFFQLSGNLDSTLFDGVIEEMPVGYRIVRSLFAWEVSCANEGWLALSNAQEGEVEEAIQCYRLVGLGAEAEAISCAHAQWLSDPENDDAIARAYGSVKNEYSDDMKRIPYIVDYLTNNASKLFYEPAI